MEPSKFDDLTKALATATSRRQALRRIGGILGGTALAGLFPGLAFASNSACVSFCNAVFGAETKAAGKCISDAAHGKGLCHTCGSSTPASSICCARNASGFCTSYSPTLPCSCDSSQCLTCDTTHGTCVGCPQGQTCQNGMCVTPCTANGCTCSGNSDCSSGNCSNNVCCASGQVGLSNGSCATPCSADGTTCSGPCGTGVCIPDHSALYCTTTATNNQTCTTDSDCNTGYFCYFIGISFGCYATC